MSEITLDEIKAKLLEIGWSNEGADFLIDKRDDHSIALFFRKLFRPEREYPVRRESRHQTPKEVIPFHIRWAVWLRDNFTCRHCGTRWNLTADHIIPESKGGKATLDNLQTLCRSCNSKKGTRQ